jgi:hypothetical protein
MRAVLHEIIRPDMVRPLGTQPNARTVIEPQPLAFGLFGWNFQPFAPPDPFYPLIIDLPARRKNSAIRR